MILLLPLLLAVQSPTSLPNPMVERRIMTLAERGSLLNSYLTRAIVDDPAMRAEWRRVGFSAGCEAFADVQIDVKARHGPALINPTADAIRTLVPSETIERMVVPSFTLGGMQVYRARIEQRLLETHGSAISAAEQDMKRSYRQRLEKMATNSEPKANIVVPKADLAAMLGVQGAWDLDKPSHLQMACAEDRMPPHLRPRLSSGSPNLTVPVTGAPKK